MQFAASRHTTAPISKLLLTAYPAEDTRLSVTEKQAQVKILTRCNMK